MRIIALSKRVFDGSFSDDVFMERNDCAFISILDVDNFESKYDINIDNFLQVRMWDIEEDCYDCNGKFYLKPSDDELIKIINFIDRHDDKTLFIVHCSAGVSRSGAVVTYIKDKFIDKMSTLDRERFLRDNRNIQPNLYILNRLKVLDGTLINQYE